MLVSHCASTNQASNASLKTAFENRSPRLEIDNYWRWHGVMHFGGWGGEGGDPCEATGLSSILERYGGYF